MVSELKQLKKNNLIKEAITLALFEQEQAGAPAPVMPNAGGGGAAQAPQAPNMGMSPPIQDPNATDPNAPPPQANEGQPEELTLDTMIERLNVIRGGKSFTDPEVYGSLTTYFKTLQPEQKTVIDSFLQGVSKVMIDVRQNTDPQQPDPNAAPPPNGQGPAPVTPQATPPVAPMPQQPPPQQM